MNTMDGAAKIRELNDLLRKSGIGGRVMLTAGIRALGERRIEKIMSAIRSFDDFNENNDPYKEHDFGKISVEGETIFFKIDYYDKSLQYASPDPADPTKTCRMMTVMLAEEY